MLREDADALAKAFPEVVVIDAPQDVEGHVVVGFRLDLGDLDRRPGGIEVGATEDIAIVFGPGHPRVPPTVLVPHERWLGQPHMIGAQQLCVYLDPARQWNTTAGLGGVLSQTWKWLDDAAAGRFDPKTALFHGLGGIQHLGQSHPTVVMRHAPDSLRPGIHQLAWTQRSSHRFEVTRWNRPPTDTEHHGLAIVSSHPLTRGTGDHLAELARRVDSPEAPNIGNLLPQSGFPTTRMIAWRLRHAARRLAPGEPLLVLVAAPNTSVSGAPGLDFVAFDFKENRIIASDLHQPVDDRRLPEEPIHHLPIDDCRPSITERRDQRRPVEWFRGKTVEVWGGGALGSWFAEVVVRAGVRRLRLRDSAPVKSGLLVRQNYTEDSVGHTKAEALAQRLRLLADDVEVEPLPHVGLDDIAADLLGLDLLVDASVSVVPAAVLDEVLTAAAPPELRVLQLATDTASATLGLVHIVRGDGGVSISAIDAAARTHVSGHAALEPFSTFWDADDDALFSPTRGCSAPTFRGSAADAMAIAAAAASLAGPALDAGLQGSYLLALPHSPEAAPARTWISYPGSDG